MSNDMDDALLPEHRRLTDAGVDEFRATASKLLTPHRITMRTTGRSDRFSGDVRSARVGDVGIVYLSQGAAVDVDILEPIDYYDVILAVRGSSGIASADDHRRIIDRAHGAVLSPGMRAGMHMSDDYGQLHVRIERSSLDRRLEAFLGRPVGRAVTFDVGLDLAAPNVVSWYDFLRLGLRDIGAGDGIAAHPLAASTWQDHLLAGLLVAQTSNYADLLDDRASGRPPRRALQAVMDYCEANIAEPISMADLATQAGMSARSLQRAFREELNMSPLEYLQNLRLACAHEDLLEGDPASSSSVTDVAYRWGFTHLSRFAAAYRARYGELPSETRRRGSIV
ncbi:AraC family transcriptional regulator [Gordonia sp. NPDC003424]